MNTKNILFALSVLTCAFAPIKAMNSNEYNYENYDYELDYEVNQLLHGDKNAIIIQSAIRGYLERKKYQEAQENINNTAKQIQSLIYYNNNEPVKTTNLNILDELIEKRHNPHHQIAQNHTISKEYHKSFNITYLFEFKTKELYKLLCQYKQDSPFLVSYFKKTSEKIVLHNIMRRLIELSPLKIEEKKRLIEALKYSVIILEDLFYFFLSSNNNKISELESIEKWLQEIDLENKNGFFEKILRHKAFSTVSYPFEENDVAFYNENSKTICPTHYALKIITEN